MRFVYDARRAGAHYISRLIFFASATLIGIVIPIWKLIFAIQANAGEVSATGKQFYVAFVSVMLSSVAMLIVSRFKTNEIKYFAKTLGKKVVYQHFTLSHKFVFGVVDKKNVLKEYYFGGWRTVVTPAVDETLVDINRNIAYIPCGKD